jgi:hypothetical protein
VTRSKPWLTFIRKILSKAAGQKTRLVVKVNCKRDV